MISLDVKSASACQLEKKLALIRKYLETKPKILRYFNGTDLLRTGRLVDEALLEKKDVILTSYFYSKSNPNENLLDAPCDDINYIAPWYESINKLQLYGIVLHDGLGDNFVNNYTTTHVKFVKCEIGNYSLNDERFIAFYIFLLKNFYRLDRALMTDARDLRFTKNPFELFDQYDEKRLFIGRNHRKCFRHDKYFHEAVRIFEKEIGFKVENNFYNQPIYNAGILGGTIPCVLLQLRQMVKYFLMCDSESNNNMIVLNYAVYIVWHPKTNRGLRKIYGKFFNIDVYNFIINKLSSGPLGRLFSVFYQRAIWTNSEKDKRAKTEHIFTGFPLCSSFKKYESGSDVYIIHK